VPWGAAAAPAAGVPHQQNPPPQQPPPQQQPQPPEQQPHEEQDYTSLLGADQVRCAAGVHCRCAHCDGMISDSLRTCEPGHRRVFRLGSQTYCAHTQPRLNPWHACCLQAVPSAFRAPEQPPAELRGRAAEAGTAAGLSAATAAELEAAADQPAAGGWKGRWQRRC
jgi:hypothetical protein